MTRILETQVFLVMTLASGMGCSDPMSTNSATNSATANQPNQSTTVVAEKDVTNAGDKNVGAPNELAAALETFPAGIWNKPLKEYARSVHPAHVVLIDLTFLDNDQWLDPTKFGLASDATGEAVAMKASRGDLYIPKVDSVTPVRGTKFAPLRLADVVEGLPPPNHVSWRAAVAGMTLQDIVQQINSYDSSHADKTVQLQSGARYGALRPDGQVILARAFGGTDLDLQFIPVGAIKERESATK